MRRTTCRFRSIRRSRTRTRCVPSKEGSEGGTESKRRSLFASIFPQAYDVDVSSSDRKEDVERVTASTAEEGDGVRGVTETNKEDVMERTLSEYGLERKEELGRGSFACVHRAEVCDVRIAPRWATAYAPNGIAIKSLLKDATKKEASSFRREMRLHARLPYDENVVRARCAHISSEAPFLATDYCECGSLRSRLRDRTLMVNAPSLAYQVALGIAHLHSNGIAHRDIKSENVMLSMNQTKRRLDAKIVDLGSACAMEDSLSFETIGWGSWINVAGTSPVRNKRVGTVPWMAPEMLSPDPEREWPAEAMGKMDVFAFGCTVWELLTRELPWRDVGGKDWRECIARSVVEEGKRLPIPDGTSPKLRELLGKCWEADPCARPTAEGLVSMLESIGPWDELGRVELESTSASTALEVVWPWKSKKTWYVGHRSATIVGRSPGCDMAIAEKHISRQHCRIQVDASCQWYVEDLGSANGTQVNGEKLLPHTLQPVRHGDVIVLADAVRVRFLQDR